MSEKNFITVARFAPNSWMTGFKKGMKKAGYEVKADGDAVVFTLDGTVVARGLSMGKMGWIVRANPDVCKPDPEQPNSADCQTTIL